MITFSQLGDEVYYGRLGNQLWQIASTIGIAMKYGHTFFFPPWKYNTYFGDRIPTAPLYNAEILREHSDNKYQEFVFDANKTYDLRGYFQNYRYIEQYIDVIKKQYLNPSLKVGEFISEVSIHVRRGDYLSRSNYHTNLTMQYYNEAMEHFPDNYGYSIFSDDIAWCKEQKWASKKLIFIHQGDMQDPEIVDLFFMAKHKNHIIANSSFSYWGSLLGNQDGKTIAPKNWFVTLDSSEMCPPNWIRI